MDARIADKRYDISNSKWPAALVVIVIVPFDGPVCCPLLEYVKLLAVPLPKYTSEHRKYCCTELPVPLVYRE